MIREMKASDLAVRAEAAREIAVAPALASSLESSSEEMVAVSWPAAEDLTSIYAFRLGRWRSGVGPSCIGLDHFVETLRGTQGPVGLFSHKDNSYFFVGILNTDGTMLLDATSVSGLQEA
jgi:hypothetical protein